jgi:hypothetical protein
MRTYLKLILITLLAFSIYKIFADDPTNMIYYDGFTIQPVFSNQVPANIGYGVLPSATNGTPVPFGILKVSNNPALYKIPSYWITNNGSLHIYAFVISNDYFIYNYPINIVPPPVIVVTN